jgi:hypothetical protein
MLLDISNVYHLYEKTNMNCLPNRVVTITVALTSRKELIMLELKVKDVRETFEETLGKFYADADFSVGSTKVMDKDKTFRIEFRIYDSEFWMNIEPAIYCVHIATRSFGEPDHLDMLHIWLRPYRYDKEHFTFGWRKDLETFFDSFHKALLEKLNKNQKTGAAAVYGSSIFNGLKDNEDGDDEAKTGENKTSIFNGLKDNEDGDDEAKTTKTYIYL